MTTARFGESCMRMQTKSYAALRSLFSRIYRDCTLQLGNVGQRLTRAAPRAEARLRPPFFTSILKQKERVTAA
jgi:hypothetical protein